MSKKSVHNLLHKEHKGFFDNQIKIFDSLNEKHKESLNSYIYNSDHLSEQ